MCPAIVLAAVGRAAARSTRFTGKMPGRGGLLALLDQGEHVAARVLEEGHPLLDALLAELAGIVAMDHRRRLQEVDAALLEVGEGGLEVVDQEVERRRRMRSPTA